MTTDSTRPTSDAPNALPIGARLGEFEVRSLLGVGGFGIVYLAFDHALEREVAVKEYMPASLAGRTETMHVTLRSRSDEETFALGLRSFVNEAKLLARFDHPSLLKVHRFWEANGTAYMAMPVLRGRTLKEVSASMLDRPEEPWVRALLMPLLGAIEALHAEGVYHRDIAPDNIQIEPGGRPVLLDFGAARRVLSDKTQTLTAILKPAYAPIEQYAEATSVKQGPWTDLYALGATLHYLLLGQPPPPATTRAVHDEPTRLTVGNVPGCSPAFLRAIEWMLSPRPADRPQSVAALREVLEGRAQPPLPPAAPSPGAPAARQAAGGGPQAQATQVMPRGDDGPTQVMPRGDDAQTLAMPRTGQAPTEVPSGAPTQHRDGYDRTMAMPRPGAARAGPVEAARPLPPAGSSSKRGLVLGIGAAVALAVVAAVALWPRARPADPALAAAASAPAAVSTPASVPAADAPSQVAESTVTTVVAGAGAATGAAASPAPAPQPPSPSAGPTVAPSPGAAQGQTSPAQPAANPPPRAAAASRPAPAIAAAAPPPAATARPAPAAARPVGQATTAPPADPPRAAAAEPAPAAATPTIPAPDAVPVRAATPEGTCGGRNPLRYIVCMEKECLKKEFGDHPDCLKWRKDVKRD